MTSDGLSSQSSEEPLSPWWRPAVILVMTVGLLGSRPAPRESP